MLLTAHNDGRKYGRHRYGWSFGTQQPHSRAPRSEERSLDYRLTVRCRMTPAAANQNRRMPAEERKPSAVGRVVHRSRRLYVAESQLIDSDGTEIARGSGTSPACLWRVPRLASHGPERSLATARLVARVCLTQSDLVPISLLFHMSSGIPL